MTKKYNTIIEHYEQCFEKYGDNHLGVDWPNEKDVETRFKVMLDLIAFDQLGKKHENIQLLDFGCGASHFYKYIVKNNLTNINYTGLDISDKFIDFCKEKYPNNDYYCVDILEAPVQLPVFDYLILNGVFTEKREMSFEDMFLYFKEMIKKVWEISKRGIAFNIMSSQVDWERDDLFHLSLEPLSQFLCKEVSRNFIVRNDYGLYEYTVYVYK
ncbi:class I SAM-dependent methyltransferase [Brevibacillus sp. 179-C 1.1 NHS]|uniref:class I SAM-dependent methyltransferase n=1 Tax=Brevibacillus sp. 179-C 1.1 NHS TaxID=3235177 RepID=UPI0039A3A71E